MNINDLIMTFKLWDLHKFIFKNRAIRVEHLSERLENPFHYWLDFTSALITVEQDQHFEFHLHQQTCAKFCDEK